MPETFYYSAVAAVQTLWLAARAYGLGVGWVSDLDPQKSSSFFEIPEAWSLVAYSASATPTKEHVDPLERHGWQERLAGDRRDCVSLMRCCASYEVRPDRDHPEEHPCTRISDAGACHGGCSSQLSAPQRCRSLRPAARNG